MKKVILQILLTGLFFLFSTDGYPRIIEKQEKTYQAEFSVTEKNNQQELAKNLFERK